MKMNSILDIFDVPAALLVFLKIFYKNRDTYLKGNVEILKN